MNLIVSVDSNWGIGYKNKLLAKIKEDMIFFKKMTVGKIVVMGRKTFESLPNCKALKNRVNIVLSSTLYMANENVGENVILCKNIKELHENLSKFISEDIFFIGGEKIYKLATQICDAAYVTKILKVYEADTYMVNLNKQKAWKKTSENFLKTECGVELIFTKYIKEKY